MRLGIIGTGFMGKAHSHALISLGHFPEIGEMAVRLVCCGTDRNRAEQLAQNFGWREIETNWEKVIGRKDIDAVIICTPTANHALMATAALSAGKHVLCEKPLARDSGEAAPMLNLARRAGVCHAVGFNYRRLPAIALAKQWLTDGRLGEIRDFHGVYLQDWSNSADTPFNWRHDLSDSGPGEQSGHIVDLARYLVGEIDSATGMMETVIGNRPDAGGRQRTVSTEDISAFMVRFASGAIGTFFSSRVAFGEKNALRLTIHGSKGSLRFDLERLNELQFSSDADPADAAGFRTILVTQPTHPYLKGWWPPGHALGWEHSFVHQMRDFVVAAGSGKKMNPDFQDGLECIAVLDAVASSAKSRVWISIQHAEGDAPFPKENAPMIDPTSKVPLYHQVYETLRGGILRGEWEPGALLPAEPELMNQYKVSRITVRQALDLLSGEGLIIRQRGRGTFVAAPSLEQGMVRIVSFTQDMDQRGMRASTEVLAADRMPAPPHIAQHLNVEAGEELIYLQRLRLADGTPLAIEESHLLHRFCPGLLKANLQNQSLRDHLDRKYGIRWSRAKQVIRAIQAAPEIARNLEVPTGDPLLHIERVSYSQQNVPVEFLRVYYRGDRYSLYNELQA